MVLPQQILRVLLPMKDALLDHDTLKGLLDPTHREALDPASLDKAAGGCWEGVSHTHPCRAGAEPSSYNQNRVQAALASNNPRNKHKVKDETHSIGQGLWGN